MRVQSVGIDIDSQIPSRVSWSPIWRRGREQNLCVAATAQRQQRLSSVETMQEFKQIAKPACYRGAAITLRCLGQPLGARVIWQGSVDRLSGLRQAHSPSRVRKAIEDRPLRLRD
jgi:hypothetical protein